MWLKRHTCSFLKCTTNKSLLLQQMSIMHLVYGTSPIKCFIIALDWNVIVICATSIILVINSPITFYSSLYIFFPLESNDGASIILVINFVKFIYIFLKFIKIKYLKSFLTVNQVSTKAQNERMKIIF